MNKLFVILLCFLLASCNDSEDIIDLKLVGKWQTNIDETDNSITVAFSKNKSGYWGLEKQGTSDTNELEALIVENPKISFGYITPSNIYQDPRNIAGEGYIFSNFSGNKEATILTLKITGDNSFFTVRQDHIEEASTSINIHFYENDKASKASLSIKLTDSYKKEVYNNTDIFYFKNVDFEYNISDYNFATLSYGPILQGNCRKLQGTLKVFQNWQDYRKHFKWNSKNNKLNLYWLDSSVCPDSYYYNITNNTLYLNQESGNEIILFKK